MTAVTSASHTHFQTRLFAADAGTPPPGAAPGASSRTTSVDVSIVSPRNAFQSALHGRSVLVDARPDAERRRDGQVGPALPHLTWTEAVAPGVRPLAGRLVVALAPAGADGTRSAVARWLRAAGAREVRIVVGGFAGWAAAGLPTAT